MKNNTQRLKNTFLKANEAIAETSKEIRTELAERMFRSVIAMSPVSTGSYVCSNRLGINSEDTLIVNKFNPFVNKESMRDEALGQLAKLASAGPFSPIYISNRITHNVNVEYTGWKKTPPYHVYGLTYEHFRLEANNITKRISQRMQLKIGDL